MENRVALNSSDLLMKPFSRFTYIQMNLKKPRKRALRDISIQRLFKKILMLMDNKFWLFVKKSW